MEYTIALDLDDTVFDFQGAFARFIEEKSGLEKNSLPEPSTWDFGNWPDFSREKFMNFYERFVRNNHLANLKAYPHASDVLWRLSDAGIYIRVVTHRLIMNGFHSIVASDTIKSLENEGIPYRDLCMVSTKHDVAANVYLDDGPRNIEPLQSLGKDVVIYTHDYNRYIPGARVDNWLDMEREIMARYRIWSKNHS